ncbi:nuclear transport factor 2 family protein [Nannocystis pusilla]|uniref:Nuclear transport factor 2 family protein n=1 Tax=Nannocystis pusilla TaxID=889268 RepID=A0ABS7TQW6_9BACT|nr:nuclear transport factor 2 family protein [Nannocystis pusilla]MBZ5710537.1 nuclear transport factor 2 family protein [Nannocystis pusilla]
MSSLALALAFLLTSTAPPRAAAAPPPAKAAPPTADLDAKTRAAIEAVAYDYVDGQLEGDAERVARALHPDLAKRAVAAAGPTAREVFPLRRMSADELIDLTRQGALKTPKEQWNRSVRVLDVTGTAAVVRVETPWFVDYFHMGRFGDRWLIVNALWFNKPQPS